MGEKMQTKSDHYSSGSKNSGGTLYRGITTITVLLLSLAMVIVVPLTGLAGISVTPLLLDFTIDPGESGTGTLTVQNTGSEPVRIESQVRGFRTSTKGTANFLSSSAAEGYPYSGEDLLELKPGEALLEPDESKKFTYKVSYPEEPRPFGGRYVGALFRAAPVSDEEEEGQGSKVEVATRVGTLILVRPSEELLAGDEFLEFEVKPEIKNLTTKTVYGGDQLLVSTRLRNSGNIHIRKKEFTGNIRLHDASGEVVEEIEIAPHNVLPETSYVLNELWKIPDEIKKEDLESHTVSVTIDVQTPYGNTVSVEKTGEVKV